MDIKAMHYQVKSGVNKLDSDQNRNLQVPEIDVVLNQAEEVFKLRHTPYGDPSRGVEYNQRAIENLRTIVVNQTMGQQITNNVASLPSDYDYFLSGYVLATKGKCDKEIKVTVYRHQDELEEFDSPSFEWGECPIRFFEGGIHVHTDGFDAQRIRLNYLRKTLRMHNAEDWDPDGYEYDGQVYVGTQDCELPERCHQEIVNLAVLIITGNLTPPNFESKAAMINLDN